MPTMTAAVLKRTGHIDRAFELQEMAIPQPGTGQVLIQVQAFGLNYADGMAIKGQYRDAPPLPSVIGYDVCGIVSSVGAGVTRCQPGDFVTAMTRFGGYAQYAVTDQRAVVKIDHKTPYTDALALATQAATAWYCTREAVSLYPGDRVLVTAAAGGVGSLVVQLCKMKGCKIYGIVSTEEKGRIAKNNGADVILNRSESDIFRQYASLAGEKAIDVMFDSAGGSYIRKAMANLAPGGRLVGYGGAEGSNAGNIFSLIKFALSFGFYHPAPFLLKSHSFTGVNMLRLADHKPEVVAQCLQSAAALYQEGQLKPLPGKLYRVDELSTAHKALAAGAVPGKMAITWE